MRTQAIAHLFFDIPLFHQEIHNRILSTASDVDLCKIVPSAGAIAHVQIKAQIFIREFVGLESDGVDSGRPHTQLVDSAVHIEDAVVLDFTRQVAHIHIVACQEARHQTTRTHFHIQLELWQFLLKRSHFQCTGCYLLIHFLQAGI